MNKIFKKKHSKSFLFPKASIFWSWVRPSQFPQPTCSWKWVGTPNPLRAPNLTLKPFFSPKMHFDHWDGRIIRIIHTWITSLNLRKKTSFCSILMPQLSHFYCSPIWTNIILQSGIRFNSIQSHFLQTLLIVKTMLGTYFHFPVFWSNSVPQETKNALFGLKWSNTKVHFSKKHHL